MLVIYAAYEWQSLAAYDITTSLRLCRCTTHLMACMDKLMDDRDSMRSVMATVGPFHHSETGLFLTIIAHIVYIAFSQQFIPKTRAKFAVFEFIFLFLDISICLLQLVVRQG